MFGVLVVKAKSKRMQRNLLRTIHLSLRYHVKS